MTRDSANAASGRPRRLVLALVLALLAGAWSLPSHAQLVLAPANPGPGQVVLPTNAVPVLDLTLREQVACPVPPRDGSATAYSLPGTPFVTSPLPGLGASFGVGEVCLPNPPLGGVFTAGGQGFGDLVAVTPGWPFGGPPAFAGCDPEADETFWFVYGSSLNNLTPGVDRASGINFPHNSIPNGCAFDDVPVEGVWFIGRRSADAQGRDISCENRDPAFPIRVGNALFCELFGTWLSGTALNPQVTALGFKACNFYSVCAADKVGGDISPRVRGGLCGVPLGPLPVNALAGGGIFLGCRNGNLATVNVLVRNALTGQALAGVNVSVDGLDSLVTGDDGRVSFSDVPTGSPVVFVASHPDFVTATGSVTPSQGETADLTISLSPPVSGARVVLSWGANPGDLDGHLITPNGEVYFGNPNVPGASLDHDATDGFGPETITVSQVFDGQYVYYVHHWSGEGTICSSGATVTVTVGTEQTRSFQPPGGCTGDDDVWNVFTYDPGNGLVGVGTITPGSSAPNQVFPGRFAGTVNRTKLPTK